MSNIAGKVIVITGASSGMGEAAARHLAALGASVVLGARRSVYVIEGGSPGRLLRLISAD